MTCRVFACLTALLTLSSTAYSQVDTSARLMGEARSAFNGRPLPAVMVAVPDARKFVVTDSTGTFLLSGLPVGKQKVFVAYEGRATEEYEFEFAHGRTKRIAVVLDVDAVDLDPVVVTVQHRDSWRNLGGFYERKRWYGGLADFYTQEDIEKLKVLSLGSVLAREGIYRRCVQQGCLPTKTIRGRTCLVAVAVDGMPFWEESYDEIPIGDVRGIEVYRADRVGQSVQPVSMFINRYGPPCAWVEIWTR